jgi:hypothetical protein
VRKALSRLFWILVAIPAVTGSAALQSGGPENALEPYVPPRVPDHRMIEPTTEQSSGGSVLPGLANFPINRIAELTPAA